MCFSGPQVLVNIKLCIIEVFVGFMAGRPQRSSRYSGAKKYSDNYQQDAEEKAALIKQKFSRIRDIIDSESD
jgi:hypothetical protein